MSVVRQAVIHDELDCAAGPNEAFLRVAQPTTYHAGELLALGRETMRVERVLSTGLAVKRGVAGSPRYAHCRGTAVRILGVQW